MEQPDIDVVAITGSAGAFGASLQVLRNLPEGFSLPIVIAFHLPLESSLVQMYARLPFRVEWATPGAMLEPGKVLVCPPRQLLELLPDGSCMLSAADGGAGAKPLDGFLESVARSFASRAIGVVLTGMGNDASVGALELHRAGGHVVVQSEASAEFPSMPAAAIACGAADIVIPLAEMGNLLGELAARTPRLRMRSEVDTIRRVFGATGIVAAHAREVDWSRTPLGPAIDWPETLRVSVRTIMDSPTPQAVWWGPEFVQLYNDAWCHFLGVTGHPQALGGRARDTWSAIWHDVGPLVASVLADGTASTGADYPLLVRRHAYAEEVFASFSYSPIRDAAGSVVGIHNNVWDTTRNVVSERRLQLLHTLAARLSGATGVRDACERATGALHGDPQDVPFALFYVLDARRRLATLTCAAGLTAGADCAPHVIALADDGVWPLAAALEADGKGMLLCDLANRCPGLPPVPLARDGTSPPRCALLLPLQAAPDEPALGVLVMGISPHRSLDDGYRSFAQLLVRQVAAAIAQGRVAERERERQERLAELDRAKTQFFANVSHEFRTPLTLMLAPLEELLRRKEALPASLVAEVEVAERNARRLVALVSNLLDFSQVESRRQPPHLAPVDLCALTTDIASHFRSAIDAAGLRLQIDCDARLPKVPVDPEMWTSVVSNLLSNALKFTFAGHITIRLNALRLHAEVVVADSGIGIPEHEIPNIFKRFHRVRGARARTAEGAGIGLSMVQDLVTRMGGQVQARSREGHGTSFVIWLPYKSLRMGVGARPGIAPAQPLPDVAADLAQQAARWILDDQPSEVLHDLVGAPHPQARPADGAPAGLVVVVDDNADMRSYLRRLLGGEWEVDACADAATALDLIRRRPPQAVVADVTMPGMDGFELLRRIRADIALLHIPVLLVTARAGESAAIEGLQAGADDYIAKPFSPRELLARVRAAIERARGEAALRESEAKYRALFNEMDDAYAVVDVLADAQGHWNDFRFVEVNPAFVRHTGMQDPVGKTAIELLGTPNPRWAAIYGQTATTGQPVRVQESEATLGRYFDLNVFRLGGDGSRRVAVLFTDVTQRKRQEQRQAYLLALSDALRGLVASRDIRAAASRLLGEQLGVNRVLYSDVVQGDWLVTDPWEHDVQPVATGHHAQAPFGQWIIDDLRAGRRLVITDVRTDARFSASQREAHLALQITAAVAVPLVKGGDLVAMLVVQARTPRAWSQADLDLIGETAERTWAAVERARAEEALRESRQRFKALLTAGTYSVYRMSPDWKRMYALVSDTLASTAEPTDNWTDKYILPEDRPMVAAAIQQAIRTRSLFDLEHRVRLADGSIGWVHSRAVPLLGADGEIVEWFGAGSDITQRRTAADGASTTRQAPDDAT